MVDSGDDDWQKLVRKTRYRPLIWMPTAMYGEQRMALRSEKGAGIFLVVFMLGFGAVCVAVALFFGVPAAGQVILLMVGAICFFGGIRKLFFKALLSAQAGSNWLEIQYGCFPFIEHVMLDRGSLSAVLSLAHQTSLTRSYWGHLSYRRFPVISLKRVDGTEEAHIGYTTNVEAGVSAFLALEKAVKGDSIDRTSEVIELPDGRTLTVRKTATWEGGGSAWYSYRSELSVPQSGVVEIDRKPLGKVQRYHFAPAYPMCIERRSEAFYIQWSDSKDASVPLSQCVGIQVCRGEADTTRYELNLITDASEDNRINLVSLDPVPHGDYYPADPHEMGNRLGGTLGLPVYDHVL